jgi:hypothetical protein
MVVMLLRHGEQICGFPAVQAGYAARTVDAWQWCSAGVLARCQHRFKIGSDPYFVMVTSPCPGIGGYL